LKIENCYKSNNYQRLIKIILMAAKYTWYWRTE